jgi:hypothetical protein
VYVPNGVNLAMFNPTETGNTMTLTRSLAPLAPFHDSINVVRNIACVPSEAQGDGGGDHSRATGAWLTGAHPKKTFGADVRAGKTVDQFAADVLGADTVLSSLQVCIDNISTVGDCDGGYACAYSNTLSWRTPTTPLPMQNNPRQVFERLFGEGTDADARRAQMGTQLSLLDAITQEAKRLQSRLGAMDRSRMNDYLDGVRELETRIQRIEAHGKLDVTSALPVGIPDSFEEHVNLMFDLQALAFQADLTRVSSFMIAREVSTRTYPEIGVPDAHHGLSHHGNDPGKLDRIAKIDTLHVSLLAHFVEKLKSISDGAGTLLDNTLVTYGSCMSNGNDHNHRSLPTVLAGGLGGQIKGGRQIWLPKDTPFSNLHLTVLHKVGSTLEKFGDSTGLADV